MQESNKKEYYYVYKITNLVNNKIYIGVHHTTDLNDGYMGSGHHLARAKEKYGIDSFTKEILLFCDSAEEMYQVEKQIVNENFVKRTDTYNIAIGGHGGDTGNYQSDARSQKLSEKSKNKVVATDKLTGKKIKISKECFDAHRDQYDGNTKGIAIMRDSDNNVIRVQKDDPNFQQYVGNTKGRVTVIDKDGNTFSVRKDDPRYVSGELHGVTYGSKQSEESNRKRSEKQRGQKKPQPYFECPFCHIKTSKTNLIRWHYDGSCLIRNKDKLDKIQSELT